MALRSNDDDITMPATPFDWNQIQEIAIRFGTFNTKGNVQKHETLNNSFQHDLEDTAGLFLTDDNDSEGPKTLAPDPVTMLKEIIVNAIMDIIPPRNKLRSIKDTYPPFLQTLRIRNKHSMDKAGALAIKQGQDTLLIEIRAAHWGFKPNWDAVHFDEVYDTKIYSFPETNDDIEDTQTAEGADMSQLIILLQQLVNNGNNNNNNNTGANHQATLDLPWNPATLLPPVKERYNRRDEFLTTDDMKAFPITYTDSSGNETIVKQNYYLHNLGSGRNDQRLITRSGDCFDLTRASNKSKEAARDKVFLSGFPQQKDSTNPQVRKWYREITAHAQQHHIYTHPYYLYRPKPTTHLTYLIEVGIHSSCEHALATFLHDSFDVPKESHSTLCEALINSQYRTWSDFLFIEYIDDLAYHDGKQGLDWEEREYYTKEAFKDYCQGIVTARRASTADGERSTKPIAQLKYESWIRKPRDETTFPVLQNDATFEHWLVQFKAQLDANGINPTTFLDPYWPDHVLTGYPKALHEEQCAFFWTLLRHVFQGDFSSSCVLYHQRTRDGCRAYFDFVKLHNPVSPPMPPAAPESTHAPVHSTSSTPAVHNSPPTTACKTAENPTVDNSETPTGLPCSSNPGSTDDSTSIGTSFYTWKYFPSTDSVRFTKITSTPSIVHTNIQTGDDPSKRNREPHSTCTRTSYPPPTNSPWTFYPQSATVVFHRARSAPQPSCTSSLQLPPSGASSKDSVVSSSATKPLDGTSLCPIRKFLYGARKPLYGASFSPAWKTSAYPVGKPLYEAHSMTYVLPAVCITKRHCDAIKLKLYHLHATLLIANWLYDDVT
eukprot:jgi/Psemu1/31397/gm1.31397_g